MSNEVMVKVEVEVEIEVEVVIVASHSHGYAKHEVVDDVLTMSHDKKQPQKKKSTASLHINKKIICRDIL